MCISCQALCCCNPTQCDARTQHKQPVVGIMLTNLPAAAAAAVAAVAAAAAVVAAAAAAAAAAGQGSRI
jgi:hypothetical protein